MPRQRPEENTRQLFAAVREDLYLAAKARASELRLPLREFIEYAIELALVEGASTEGKHGPSVAPRIIVPRTLWDTDDVFREQVQLPVGAEVELSIEDAERAVRAVFGTSRQRGGNPRG
ncbi:MAG: hypothetical protein ACRDIB_00290 [Ardenticatenaceae bacterium]